MHFVMSLLVANFLQEEAGKSIKSLRRAGATSKSVTGALSLASQVLSLNSLYSLYTVFYIYIYVAFDIKVVKISFKTAMAAAGGGVWDPSFLSLISSMSTSSSTLAADTTEVSDGYD